MTYHTILRCFSFILHQCPLSLCFLLPKAERFSITALHRFMLRMPVRLMLRLMHLMRLIQCGASDLGLRLSQKQDETRSYIPTPVLYE